GCGGERECPASAVASRPTIRPSSMQTGAHSYLRRQRRENDRFARWLRRTRERIPRHAHVSVYVQILARGLLYRGRRLATHERVVLEDVLERPAESRVGAELGEPVAVVLQCSLEVAVLRGGEPFQLGR